MGALTTFQSMAAIVAGVILVATVAAAVSHAIDWRTAFAWCVLWIAAAVAILRPSITVTIAHFLGIGRGADLVFYCGMLGMLLGFFAVYVRIKRLESEITRLVRTIALRDADDRRDAATR
jgi:hypothetical protein